MKQGGMLPPEAREMLEQLEAFGLLRLQFLPPAPKQMKPRSWGKVQLWRLHEFELVLYVDADTLVVGNLHELFQRASSSEGLMFAAAPTRSMSAVNAGVMLLRPNGRASDVMSRS